MFKVGYKVQHIDTGQYGSAYAVDAGSASVPGDQVISVKFDDGTSVGAARASEFKLVTRRADRESQPSPKPLDWMK